MGVLREALHIEKKNHAGSNGRPCGMVMDEHALPNAEMALHLRQRQQ